MRLNKPVEFFDSAKAAAAEQVAKPGSDPYHGATPPSQTKKELDHGARSRYHGAISLYRGAREINHRAS
jgi:hypothetical protein